MYVTVEFSTLQLYFTASLCIKQNVELEEFSQFWPPRFLKTVAFEVVFFFFLQLTQGKNPEF